MFPANSTFSSSYANVNGYFQSDIALDGNVSFSSEVNQILLSTILYPLNTSFSSQYNLFLEQLPSPSTFKSVSQKKLEKIRKEKAINLLNK